MKLQMPLIMYYISSHNSPGADKSECVWDNHYDFTWFPAFSGTLTACAHTYVRSLWMRNYFRSEH
jgi:hypothetical protein